MQVSAATCARSAHIQIPVAVHCKPKLQMSSLLKNILLSLFAHGFTAVMIYLFLDPTKQKLHQRKQRSLLCDSNGQVQVSMSLAYTKKHYFCVFIDIIWPGKYPKRIIKIKNCNGKPKRKQATHTACCPHEKFIHYP